jgi:cellulose biosynthesis protein BcsQ
MSNGFVISVNSSKGGVAKSSSVRSLAYILNDRGYKVGILDFCQNSSVALHFTNNREQFKGSTVREWIVENKPIGEVIQRVEGTNIYFIPSDDRVEEIPYQLEEMGMEREELKGALDRKIEPLRSIFDFILIDTHPSENDKNALMSVVAAKSNGMVIIPTLLEKESITATKRMAQICRDEKIQYIILPAKVKTGFFGKQVKYIKELEKEFKVDGLHSFSKNFIRESSVIPDMSLSGASYQEMKDNKYAARVLDDYDKLIEVILTYTKEETTV